MLADGNIYCGCYNIKKRNCLGKVEKNNLKSSEEKHKLIALLTVYKTGEAYLETIIKTLVARSKYITWNPNFNAGTDWCMLFIVCLLLREI